MSVHDANPILQASTPSPDILEHLGLRSDLVPITPARAPPSPPHPELDFG